MPRPATATTPAAAVSASKRPCDAVAGGASGASLASPEPEGASDGASEGGGAEGADADEVGGGGGGGAAVAGGGGAGESSWRAPSSLFTAASALSRSSDVRSILRNCFM